MSRSRFKYDQPGIFRGIGYMILYQSAWREKMRAWINDHELEERFQLSEDEEIMMRVLSENMFIVENLEKVPFRQLNKFWGPNGIDAAKDCVLAAISARRHGDAREWSRLKGMEPDEWIVWLREIVGDNRPR